MKQRRAEADAAGLPVFVVDAGDTGWRSRRVSSGRKDQQVEKLRLQLAAMELGGIDAWTPGEGDLALGADAVFAAAEAAHTPVVATNLDCPGHGAPRWRVAEHGGVRLGFVSALDPALVEGGVGGCTASDPDDALASALAELPDDLDAVVLLSQMDLAGDYALAEQHPRLDFVVNGHVGKRLTTPNQLPHATVHLSSGNRGKALGVATVHFVEGADGCGVGAGGTADLERKIERYRDRLAKAEALLAAEGADAPDERTRERALRQKAFYAGELGVLEQRLALMQEVAAEPRHRVDNELVDLDADIADDEATARLVADTLARIEQSRGERPASPATAVAERPLDYVGSAACAACHRAEHAQWQATPHAAAWTSLEQRQRTQDLSCWSCHVTGGERPGGPQSPAEVTEALQGVGCESCHGPGRRHIAQAVQAASTGEPPGVGEAADAVTGSIVRDPPEQTCRRCHDGEQDEGRFDWASYRAKVVHGG
ncbi:MAG: hypothetical protein D6798_04060 [Deltaproteobacteria bacterium]|nr:MAG: hypothetical protein D6798_04060 [Deltaproteobacteria bacterium]